MVDLAARKTSNGRFGYEAAGDPGATPLVFLHGIGGAARAWRGQLAHFSDRFHAMAWDMPGYGGSQPLASVSISSLASALKDFLHDAGANKPIIVGHSIGGMIVQQLLAGDPAIAKAVVLAQTSPAFGKADGDWQKTFIDARLGPLDRGETMRQLAPSLVMELVGDNPDDAGMDVARECMASVPEASYRAMMLALMGFDLRAALKNIAVPALLLSGSKDNNAPAPMMAKTASFIPGVRYIELAGVGHLANLERPAEFNAALDGFLKAIPSMTTQPAADLDAISLDAPIFDPRAFRLNDEQAAIMTTARRLGQTVFAGRAATYDREAKFPSENYKDLHASGLLGIAIPKKHGGLGADYQTYAITAAEIGRYCGATALTWNMHVCSTLWSGPLADDLDMDDATRAEHERRRAIHYKRIVDNGAIYSQPFSEGGAAAAGGVAFGTEAKPVKGGWIVNGKKIFASLSGHADYYGVLCTELAEGEKASRRNTLYLALPAKAEGVSVVGDWDPLGMRGTVSRTLIFKDVFVAEDEALMPRGVYFKAASSWPHMFLTLSPTYVGLAQAAYDFTVRYLRGEVPGTPPVKRRMYPTKQIAVAQMQIKLEQIKAIWFQAVTEAGPNPTKEQVLRAYAAQYSAMEGANEIATLAIRTCGGQAMLKSLPLERIYRDSRCGSLMLPWTAELCLDRIGREALYEAGEKDE